MKVLYLLINNYTRRFSFPKKGWKYFHFLLKVLKLETRFFQKKIYNGLLMYVNTTDHIQKNLFWYGSYEGYTSHIWQACIKADSIVLDIGANIGYYSLLAAPCARDGHIYSFEPVTPIRDQFLKNISLNCISNITVLPFCVGNKNEATTFFIASGNNIGMSGLCPPENFSGRTEIVSAVVLDDWIRTQEIEKVDAIKIDIEGAEMKALEGMQNAIEKFRPIVFIEIIEPLLKRFNYNAADVYDFFLKRDYKAFTAIGNLRLRSAVDKHQGYEIIFFPENYNMPASISIA